MPRNRTEHLRDAILLFVDNNEPVLQSKIKPHLQNEYGWVNDAYADTSLSSKISRLVRELDVAGKLEVEAGHHPDGPGRPTNMLRTPDLDEGEGE